MVNAMMAQLFNSLPEFYIEFRSRLDALGTFLRELEGDEGAQKFLLSYTDRLRCDLAGESAVADDLRKSLGELRQVVAALDHCPHRWDLAREAHEACRAEFAQFQKALRTTPSLFPDTMPFEWAT
jgi:predicted ArsR family transcriptional regulator